MPSFSAGCKPVLHVKILFVLALKCSFFLLQKSYSWSTRMKVKALSGIETLSGRDDQPAFFTCGRRWSSIKVEHTPSWSVMLSQNIHLLLQKKQQTDVWGRERVIVQKVLGQHVHGFRVAVLVVAVNLSQITLGLGPLHGWWRFPCLNLCQYVGGRAGEEMKQLSGQARASWKSSWGGTGWKRLQGLFLWE